MPIKIADSLPARAVLESERISVITEFRAIHQDIRPLKVLILNLMPTKIVTEIQLLRKLSNTPLQIDVDLMYTSSHQSTHVDSAYLASFYKTFDEVRNERYDGMIITGAPVENMEFENVEYWSELTEIMDWSKTNVFSTLYLCWGAFAGLYYNYGIAKHQLNAKMFGVFKHRVLDLTNPLFRGFDDFFYAPHSRHTEIHIADIECEPQLKLLATSDEAGLFAAMSVDERQIYILGHPEYDAYTLASEYNRDVKRGLNIAVPKNYFPDDDPSKSPLVTWRAHGQLLYTNWLNYCVYQATPYDLRDLSSQGNYSL